MKHNYDTLDFAPPTAENAYTRIAIVGVTGAGKTWTSLEIASSMCKNVAIIDTENGSASKYKDHFRFETINLRDHSPGAYRHWISRAQERGFDGLIIDSLSHAWSGRGGALEMADNASARYKGNTWAAWRDVTPEHNLLVDALIYAQLHLFVTMRAKTEWHVEKDEKGKVRPVKVGLAPIQRAGLEYEFDIVADMDANHTLAVTKTRCSALDNAVIRRPDGKVLATQISDWLDGGTQETAADTSPTNADSSAPADNDFALPDTAPDGPVRLNEADSNGATPPQRRQLLSQVQERGDAIYGSNWPEIRRRNISRLTNDATSSLSNLKSEQLATLLAGLNQLSASPSTSQQ